jgi:hypothetical protein
MKLLIMHFITHNFIPFSQNILLGTLFSNTLTLYSFLNAWDQISHPYTTTGQIIVSEIANENMSARTRCYKCNSQTFIRSSNSPYSLQPCHVEKKK